MSTTRRRFATSTRRIEIPHLRIRGNRNNLRHIPLHPATQELLTNYLRASPGVRKTSPLFRPLRNTRGESLERPITTDSIYKIVRGYAKKLGLWIGVHTLRATAATNALDHQADISQVAEWLGPQISRRRDFFDRRKSRWPLYSGDVSWFDAKARTAFDPSVGTQKHEDDRQAKNPKVVRVARAVPIRMNPGALSRQDRLKTAGPIPHRVTL